MNNLKTFFISTVLSCVVFLTVFTVYHNPSRMVNIALEISAVETYRESDNVMYSNNFLLRFTKQDVQCLQANIFFEAANQTRDGKLVVGQVTLNRVNNRRFPNTVCGVITAGKRDSNDNMVKYQCAFSWYCDGLSDRPKLNNSITYNTWDESYNIALGMLKGDIIYKTTATHYHTVDSKPYWHNHPSMVKLVTVDDHILYEEKPNNI